MTKREMFAYIAENLCEDEVVAFCENEISLIDKKNAKAKERAAKKAAEDELYGVVKGLLTDELKARTEIAAAITGEDGEPVSVAKVGARLTKLVNDGVAVKEDIKVTDEEGKTKTVKGYKLAQFEVNRRGRLKRPFLFIFVKFP